MSLLAEKVSEESLGGDKKLHIVYYDYNVFDNNLETPLVHEVSSKFEHLLILL